MQFRISFQKYLSNSKRRYLKNGTN